MNKATQKQALTAAVRTALQTFDGFLVAVLVGGGLLGSVTDIRTVPWVALGGVLGAGVLIAVLSGLRAYIGWVVNGIPATYALPAADAPVTPAPVAAVAVPTPADPAQPAAGTQPPADPTTTGGD